LIGRLLRRVLVICFAFLIAAGAGALFLPLAALADPVLRETGLRALGSTLLGALDEPWREPDLGWGLAVLGQAFWAVLVGVCAAPLAFAALLGEMAGTRSLIWHAGASGALAAASPWILRAARGLPGATHANPLEIRVAVLFFLTGALTGAVYWLIAARAEKLP
jgi:hypothetical protein